MKTIKIGNRLVGEEHLPYYVADIGANHDGNLERAFQLIERAKEAGADAAKFQNFQAEKIVSKFGFDNLQGKLSHQAKWDKSVFEVYKDASVSFDWTAKLKEKCNEVGIDYFTSPYDFESVNNIDQYVDLYKIGSGDITWLDIIKHIAKKGKPVLLATGASNMQEVVLAMNVLEAFNSEIVLMQCNTNYTLDSEKYKFVNLNVLKTFSARFPNVVLGLSDHTLGHSTVLGAIALGARVIEKHFTDDNTRNGPDHKFAMNPQTWRDMVTFSNEVYFALGDGIKRLEENEKESIVVQRRALRATCDIKSGQTINISDLESLRPIPSDGFAPFELELVLGKTLKRDILKGEHISKNDLNI
ncbi:MAG: N-acetylneuraminate synthase family protein [Leadbetterella sp.]|nr:N-acetylneuraminate synthase family protein [Leadbetterella sp.]